MPEFSVRYNALLKGSSSIERLTLFIALNDVDTLLRLYKDTQVTGKYFFRQSKTALLRSGIILSVSAWETYIEDTLREEFSRRIDMAMSPLEVENPFNALAQFWYDSIVTNSARKPKPLDFIKWTGDDWKTLLTEKFETDVSSLNTPNSANIDHLYKKYLEIKITDSWSWKGVSSAVARKKLNQLIELRGKLAHSAKGFIQGADVSPQQVRHALGLILNLSECIDKKIDPPTTDWSSPSMQ